MDKLVLTVLGDDRAGLVGALSGAIATNKGNWEQSQMAELAGKFAGVVVVSVPEAKTNALILDLDRIEASGLLDITVERAAHRAGGTLSEELGSRRFGISVVGQDSPGIVHDLSQGLAEASVTIEQLGTGVEPAPMGGTMFRAEAIVEVPAGLDLDDLRELVEQVSGDLIVDVTEATDV